MATYQIKSPDGSEFEINAPDSATEDQVMRYAQEQWAVSKQKPEPGLGEKVNQGIASLPRQLGLTARHGIEGLADVAGIVANPIAATANAMGANLPRLQTATSGALDWMGLPKPATPTERVVGDMSRMLSGGGGMVKGAQLAGKAAPALNALAARPGLQAASAVGSGGAGGYVRETGGDPLSQGVAAVAGGLLAPAGLAGVQAGARGVGNAIAGMRTPPPNINIVINNALESSGYKPSSLPRALRATLESDVANAMRQGDMSPDALRRLVDYRMVGATPARGNLTLNPIDLTNQHNLSKIGANSSNTKLQGLAMRQNDNTGSLIRNLNNLGANTADDAFAGGQKVMSGLERTATRRQGEINAAYDSARNTTGIDATIDPAAFTQRAGDLLKQNLLEGALPADVRRILNDAATGKMPLTVRTAEQIKTAMGNLQRSSADGGTRRAIGLVRQALDDAPILQSAGDDSVQAFNAARGLNRNWRGLVERTPALQAIEDGVQPDKFVQQYIIQGAGKANVMDVARLKNAIKDTPEALQAVRGQLMAHLKSKAMSGKPDEAMTFSQSGYNNAFSAIGERKLRMFFNREEIDQLKAVGRVAMYEQIQPSGSAVNNSNSGALMASKLFDLLGNSKLVNSLPFGSAAIGVPAKTISTSIQGAGVTNLPKALTLPKQSGPMASRIPLPMLLTPGLLEDRRH